MNTIKQYVNTGSWLALLFSVLAQAALYGQTPRADFEKSPGRLADTPTISGARIAGVWISDVDITNCLTGDVIFSFNAMGLFGLDGTFLDTNSQNPVLKSSTFGYWDHVVGNKYKFASRWFRFAPDGTYLGTTVVRHDLYLSKDGESYESAGTATLYDPNGNQVMQGCSAAHSVRFR